MILSSVVPSVWDWLSKLLLANELRYTPAMNKLNTYLVGGAVRDHLLGIDSKDRDWVVIGSTPDTMLRLGFSQVGADFPVFLHPDTKEEYALARTERKKGQGYLGFECDFSSNVSLEEDLLRRDLTINAMAMDDKGLLIDPFGGKKDLDAKKLRHVSKAFTEDPLRILRVARFAARFADRGFTVADETLRLMQKMVGNGEVRHLTTERVWQETYRALTESSPWIYFETLRNTRALRLLFPELDALFGVPQPEKYHPEIDSGLHSLMTLQQACRLSDSADVRFAALMHDLGKALSPKAHWPSHHGHENKGLKVIKQLCKRLRTPGNFRDLALLVCEFHTHIHRAQELKSKTILKVLKQCDAFRRPERFDKILLCSKADARGRTGFEQTPYPQADFFASALKRAQSVNINTLREQGFKGQALGEQIDLERNKMIQQYIKAAR